MFCTVRACVSFFLPLPLAEQDQVGESGVKVTEDHPEVLALVKTAVESFPQEPPPATNEMLVEALRLQVEALHEAKVEQENPRQ